jgi:hypothetical protein
LTIEKIPSTQWAYNAAISRPGEEPQVLETVILKPPQMSLLEMAGENQSIRESALEAQNVDKGFAHFVSHYRPNQPVGAAIWTEKGHHGDWCWGVFFQQGRHRCILAGVSSGRPEEEGDEDALWTACAAWANFEPVLGQPKAHPETLLFQESCTHSFEGNEDPLHE